MEQNLRMYLGDETAYNFDTTQIDRGYNFHNARITRTGNISQRKVPWLRDTYFLGVLETGADPDVFWALFTRGKDTLVTRLQLDHKKNEAQATLGVFINTAEYNRRKSNIVFDKDAFYFLDPAHQYRVVKFDIEKCESSIIYENAATNGRYIMLGKDHTLLIGNMRLMESLDLEDGSIKERYEGAITANTKAAQQRTIEDCLRYKLDKNRNSAGVVDAQTEKKFLMRGRDRRKLLFDGSATITHDGKILYGQYGYCTPNLLYLRPENSFKVAEIILMEE